MKWTLIFSLCFFLQPAWTKCVEKKRFVKGGAEDIGYYIRIHPSGNFALSSIDRHVRIYDLRQNPARVLESPANEETYPVEGSWTLLASPNHPDGMRYYRFTDVLTQQIQAQPVFNDAEHNQYYHSSAEFADSNPEKLSFRTVLWERLAYRDYKVSQSATGMHIEKSPVQRLCEVVMEKGENVDQKLEQNREKQNIRNARQASIISAMDELRSRYANATSEEERHELRSRYVRLDTERAALRQGQEQVSQPIVSKDGEHLAAIAENGSQHTLQVFKIHKNACIRVADTGFSTGNATFAYPQGGKHQLAFTASGLIPARWREPRGQVSDELMQRAISENQYLADGVRRERQRGASQGFIRQMVTWFLGGAPETGSDEQVYTYDVDSGQLQRISDPGEAPSYPGFTRDGRIIYKGRSGTGAGFYIVDPNQLPGGSGKCITEEQVAAAAGGTPSAR